METTNSLPALISQATTGVELKVAEMQVRSERAKAALVKITEITSDEQDSEVEGVLVKVRNTYDAIKAIRMEMTAPLDNVKKLLMEPEKLISNESGIVNEYSRVKKLRDKYANEKAEAESKRIEEIKRNQDIETEKIRVRNIMDAWVEMGIVKAVQNLAMRVKESLDKATIETIDELAKKIAKGSELKEEVYHSWFTTNPSFNSNLISEEIVEELKNEVRKVKTFHYAADQYRKDSSEELEKWSDRIPSIRENLLKSKEEAQAAIAKVAEESKLASEEKEKQVIENSESKLNAQTMGEAFKAQISMQEGAATIGGKVVKKAVINACNEDFVVTMSELFFAVFTHPKFPGVIKTDKKGIQQFNEDGSPVYVDWLDGMLSFYANNCSQKINHILVTNSISTIQKKK